MRKLIMALIMAGLLTLATASVAFAAPGDITQDGCQDANAGHDLDGNTADNTSIDGGPAGLQCVDGNSEAAP